MITPACRTRWTAPILLGSGFHELGMPIVLEAVHYRFQDYFGSSRLGKLIACYFKASVFVGLGTGCHKQPPGEGGGANRCRTEHL